MLVLIEQDLIMKKQIRRLSGAPRVVYGLLIVLLVTAAKLNTE